MGAIASQITSLTIVHSTVNSGTDQRKHQSSTSLAFVRGIHRWPVNSPHKGPVTRKMFPFDDVIMNEICPKVQFSSNKPQQNTIKDVWIILGMFWGVARGWPYGHTYTRVCRSSLIADNICVIFSPCSPASCRNYQALISENLTSLFKTLHNARALSMH